MLMLFSLFSGILLLSSELREDLFNNLLVKSKLSLDTFVKLFVTSILSVIELGKRNIFLGQFNNFLPKSGFKV